MSLLQAAIGGHTLLYSCCHRKFSLVSKLIYSNYYYSIMMQLCRFFTVTLFCGVNVDPFITALAVGLIIMTASVTLPLFIDKVELSIRLHDSVHR